MAEKKRKSEESKTEVIKGLEKKVNTYEEIIAERDRAQEELMETEERWRLLIEHIPDIIATVDRYGTILALNHTVSGLPAEDRIGKSVDEYVFPEQTDVVKQSLKKVFETGESDRYEVIGLNNSGQASAWYETRVIPIRKNGEVVAVTIIATDITDRKQAEESVKKNLDVLKKILDGTVKSLGMMAEQKDPYTAGHQLRVSQLAHAIGTEMGLSPDEVEGVRTAGALHDIGKISVPTEIITKPGPLSKVEFAVVETHCKVGHDILDTIEFPWPVAQMVLQHHERMDGSGYPQELSGDGILIEARVLGVSDVVEAISSNRPYRPALGLDKALGEVYANKGTRYDADVTDACVKIFEEQRFKFE